MDDTADGTVLTTYRIKSADWTNSIVAADPTSPNGLVYHTAMNALGTSPVVVVGATTGMDYMDQLHCNKDSAYHFTCNGWQVNWKSSATTDGYPRFGVDETLWAGTIDAAATTKATAYKFSDLQIVGAVYSIAAGITGAAAMLLTF